MLLTENQYNGQVNHLIKQNTIHPPGTECHIWVGFMDKATGQPMLLRNEEMPGGLIRRRKIWVKRWVAFGGPLVVYGHMPHFKTSCGMGRRCINSEHQEVIRQVPFREWDEKRSVIIEAAKRAAFDAAAVAENG